MNDYYLRCRMSDFPKMLGLGRLLGVIKYVDGVITPVGQGVWDEIGWKYQVGGEPAGGIADPYMHVNLRTEHNLRDLAQVLAASKPEVAAGLSQLSKYFITDKDGMAVPPEFPLRVFL